MPSELKSLSSIFQKRLFRIPDYQRGYAWRHEQLADFWEDLLNLHEDKYHYTGLLSLKEVPKSETKVWGGDGWLLGDGFRLFHVVDGQQRLTTFSILLFEIASFVQSMPENTGKADDKMFLGIKPLKEIKAEYILRKRPPHDIVTTYLFGYETDNPSADYLKYKIFEEKTGGTVVETYYTKNLKYAKNFFANNLLILYESEGITGIERLYRKLTLRLMFNLHEIEDDYDVFVAFETMNNRGKKLTNLELLKNRLIYLTTLFDNRQLEKEDKAQLRKDINDAWKEVYYQLGRNKNTPLPDDDFLRAHWITYFRYSRNASNDYIRFLLGKFSAKNVFELHTMAQTAEDVAIPSDFEQDEADNDSRIQPEIEPMPVSKLAPKEISDYVNSLKSFAQFWYISFFPFESELSEEEKVWIDKLNRIGIGYFRPLVAAALAIGNKTTVADRIVLFKSIERFIFISFRIGGLQSNNQSSVYYSKARDVLSGGVPLASISDGLNAAADTYMESAIQMFSARMKTRFDSGDGYYSWNHLHYFLYEYESEKAEKYHIAKLDWSLFTKVEAEKVTIEHILPQTPTKWYWRNMFRAYTAAEINVLSASLGNLLPLAQSINSSLQNDSFPCKKNLSAQGRRGYINGSHSEIEIAQEQDWTAKNILNRGMTLLTFMEKRWRITISKEAKAELLHINFVNDRREVPPELPSGNGSQTEENITVPDPSVNLTDWQQQLFSFWSRFHTYCKSQGRDIDIAYHQPRAVCYYDVFIGRSDCHIALWMYRQKKLSVGIYIYRPETFKKLESRKAEMDALYGSPLEWNRSRANSSAKKIVHTIHTDIHNPELYSQHFQWFIDQFDKLKSALAQVDTII